VLCALVNRHIDYQSHLWVWVSSPFLLLRDLMVNKQTSAAVCLVGEFIDVAQSVTSTFYLYKIQYQLPDTSEIWECKMNHKSYFAAKQIHDLILFYYSTYKTVNYPKSHSIRSKEGKLSTYKSCHVYLNIISYQYN